MAARDELGHEGQDPDRIQRLAQHMRNSRAHTTTLDHHTTVEYDYHRLDPPSRSPEFNGPGLHGFTRLFAPPDRRDRGHEDAHDRGR